MNGEINHGTGCRAIVGINWGDEGKGRMVDLMTEEFDVVIRFQGGCQAAYSERVWSISLETVLHWIRKICGAKCRM